MFLLVCIAHAEPDPCTIDHPIPVEEMGKIFDLCTVPVGTIISVQMEEIDSQTASPKPGIGFKTNDIELSKNGKETLDGVVGILSVRKRLTVMVVGYADKQEQGDLMQLSKMRAESASRYIIDKGIDPARVRVEAGGTSNPIDESGSREGSSRNRRVEFVVSAS